MDDATAPWVLSGGLCVGHAALRARAARAASGFRALGVRDGDAVALLLGNGLPHLEASLAAGLAGAYPVPIDPAAPPGVADFILRDCGARLLVADCPAPPGVDAALPRVPGDPPGWAAWAERHPPLDAPAAAPPGAVIYTSGTTGRPKGVRRAPAPAGSRPARALTVYGFDRPGRAVALVDGPLSHSVPNAFCRLALAAGADLVLRPDADPEALLDAVARHRVTHLHVVPAQMARLLALPAAVRAAHDVSSLRHVAHGAAPCPPALKRAMAAWWGPVFHEYYGSTETGLVTFQGPDEALAYPAGVGRALPGIAIHILDPEGRPLPPGAVGAVYAGSDTLHRFTFIGDDARRAAAGRGDLVTAGDVGRVDAEGRLTLLGRAAEAIPVPGGGDVHPAAVEAALSELAGVGDCAVFGVPGPHGDEVVACVSPGPGPASDPAALRAALAARLRPEEVPRRIVVLERLPRAPSGKMLKGELRALFGGPASRDG